METGLRSSISKFDDDTKVGGKTLTMGDSKTKQKDLAENMQCSEKWQIFFNFDKCKVMHTGCRNSNYAHNMRGKPLRTVKEASDPGVPISSVLKPTKKL